MANHGYLNRSGRNLTLYELVNAQVSVFNFSYQLAMILSLGGLLISGNGITLDLEQLRLHNWISIEHDASLGRQDTRTGNNWSIDPSLVHSMLAQCSSSKGLSFTDIARLRVHREDNIPGDEPLDKLHVGVALREACLVIAQLGRGSAERQQRVVNPEWIKAFFLEERFPDDWTKPTEQLGFQDTKVMSDALGEEMAKYRESRAAKMEKYRQLKEMWKDY